MNTLKIGISADITCCGQSLAMKYLATLGLWWAIEVSCVTCSTPACCYIIAYGSCHLQWTPFALPLVISLKWTCWLAHRRNVRVCELIRYMCVCARRSLRADLLSSVETASESRVRFFVHREAETSSKYIQYCCCWVKACQRYVLYTGETDFQKGRELTQALRQLAKLSLRCQMLAYLKVCMWCLFTEMDCQLTKNWPVLWNTKIIHTMNWRNNFFSSVWSANGVVIGVGLQYFHLACLGIKMKGEGLDKKVYSFNVILLHVCLLGFWCLHKCPFKCFLI